MAQPGLKKRTPAMRRSPQGSKRSTVRARSIEINVGDGLADGAFLDHGFLIDQPSHQGRGADLIDAPRNALGVFEDTLQGIVGEERAGGVTRDADLMFDIAEGLLQIERAEGGA